MYIASASTTVKFHEFPNGNVIHNYQPGSKVEGPIRSLSWSKDGTWLALVPFSGQADVVSVKDQLRLIKTIADIEEPSCAAFLNSTKKLIALGTNSGNVMIYDVKSKGVTKKFPKAPSAISHIDLSANDTHCVAGCTSGDIFLYSNLTNNLSCTFKVPKSKSVTTLRTNPFKRNLILAGSNEGVVVVWDSNVNKSKFTMEAHKAPVTSLAFSPVNSDLIVSTGSDRRFCFYDIVDRKCIASVSVDNSVTSVDFSPEGTYFVMGAQNGRIYVHDSRNIQDPVHSFVAHTSTVKHLLFQRCSEVDSSFSNISSESVVASPSSEDANNSDSELFGMFIQIPSNEVVESIRTSGNSMEGGDSFIGALGLDKNNTVESPQQEDSSTLEDARKSMNLKNTPSSVNLTKNVLDKVGFGDASPAPFASTPKMFQQSSKSFVPLTTPAFNGGCANVIVSGVQSAVKEVVKEELKSVLEEIKADIKYQSTHITYQMRRMVLDLQMAMVREFIKIEDHFNNIRDDLTSESPRQAENNYLFEENQQLKKRIEVLEQQISFLNASDKSQTDQSG